MKCPNCGEDIDPDASYRSETGAEPDSQPDTPPARQSIPDGYVKDEFERRVDLLGGLSAHELAIVTAAYLGIIATQLEGSTFHMHFGKLEFLDDQMWHSLMDIKSTLREINRKLPCP